MRIPQFVQDVLAEFENRTEPFNEVAVCDSLRAARQGQGDLSDEEFKGFRAENSAFFLHERRDCDSVWGTYFAPFFSGTRSDGTEEHSPDIGQLDAEDVSHWEARARTTKNPVLRARYADLVWELKRHITGEPPDVEYARVAIDSYLEAAEKGFYTVGVHGIQWVERGLDLSLSISDPQRVKRTVEFMFEFHDRIAIPQHPGTWMFLFDDLYGKPNLISPEQEAAIISNLESTLAKVSNRANKETFDPWGAEFAAERLATHYQRHGDQQAVERVIKAYGGAFENLARDAKPMLAMAWLQPVFEKYQQTGLKADAERVQLASMEKARNVEADMKKASFQVELTKDELEGYLDEMTSGDLRTALLRVAVQFISNVDDARQFMKKTAQEFPLQALISVMKVADGQIVARAGSVEHDEEARLHMQLAEEIQISHFFLVEVLRRLRERHNPSAEQLMDVLLESPIFDGSARGLLQEGLRAYQEGGFVKAIHVLIPQIERALRNLLALLAIPMNKPVRGRPGIMQLKNMNDVLADERVRASLQENLCRYLQVVLVDRRGLNLRNRVAHGLVGRNEFSRPVADRVFHALLAISLLRQEAEANADTDASASPNLGRSGGSNN